MAVKQETTLNGDRAAVALSRRDSGENWNCVEISGYSVVFERPGYIEYAIGYSEAYIIFCSFYFDRCTIVYTKPGQFDTV